MTLIASALEIRWSPGHQVGHPTIAGTRIRPEDVAGRVWAGETVGEVAEDFGLDVQQVRLACWFFARWPFVVNSRRPTWQVAACDAWADWSHHWYRASFWDHSKPTDPPAKP